MKGRMCALKRPHTDWQKGRLPSQGGYFDYSQVEVKLFFNIKRICPPPMATLSLTSLHLETASDISCTF